MPFCCAVGCKNRGCKLFCVPGRKEDEERRNIWLARIKTENFKPRKNLRLCEAHFDADQFKPLVPGKLKGNAVPTIFSHCIWSNKGKFSNKKSSLAPETSSTNPRSSLSTQHVHVYITPPSVDKSRPTIQASINNNCTSTEINLEQKSENLFLKSTNTNSHSTLSTQHDHGYVTSPPVNERRPTIRASNNCTKTETYHELKSEIRQLKRKLCASEKEMSDIKANLGDLFNEDQMQFLKKLTAGKGITWSDDTVKKAFDLLFACGTKGYDTLLEQGFPFPSRKTLQRRLQNSTFNHGLIPEVFNRLSAKFQSMTDQERKEALVLDEMEIQPSLESCDSRNVRLTEEPETFHDSNDNESDSLETNTLMFMARELCYIIGVPEFQVLKDHFDGNASALYQGMTVL